VAKRAEPPTSVVIDKSLNRLFRILAAQTAHDLRSLVEHCDVAAGTNLFDPGDSVSHALFPLGPTIVGLVVPMRDGTAIEAASVGREGMLGGFVNPTTAFSRATVRISGTVARLPIGQFAEVLQASPRLRTVIARYEDCFTGQLLQSVGCAALHDLEARCASWLLLAHDRLQASDAPLTQEALAEMFGVSRTYLTRIANALQNRGAISYRRGLIRIQDRRILQTASCECYELVRQHYESILPGLHPNSEL
jgi:AraC-like DNA-binding protein